VLTIVLDGVAREMPPTAANELLAALLSFEDDESARVAVVTGSGDAFAGPVRTDDAEPFAGWPEVLCSTKPVVAAVNGPARADGFGLALACDLVVAAERATFHVFDESQVGPPRPSFVDLLSKHLPRKRAALALLTGGAFTAPEGVLLGFVNELASAYTLSTTAHALASQLCVEPVEVARVRLGASRARLQSH
jgi:enoyl-CoA hydratase/carnithine racemase